MDYKEMFWVAAGLILVVAFWVTLGYAINGTIEKTYPEETISQISGDVYTVGETTRFYENGILFSTSHLAGSWEPVDPILVSDDLYNNKTYRVTYFVPNDYFRDSNYRYTMAIRGTPTVVPVTVPGWTETWVYFDLQKLSEIAEPFGIDINTDAEFCFLLEATNVSSGEITILDSASGASGESWNRVVLQTCRYHMQLSSALLS